jgi:AMMECR1 domain-containing protein
VYLQKNKIMYKVKHGQEGVIIANGNYPAGLCLGDATQEQLAELQAAMPHLIELESPTLDVEKSAKKPINS